jgi:hypothetical protein
LSSSAFQTGHGSLNKHATLLLCYPAKNCQQKGTRGSTAVQPWLANADDLNAQPIKLQDIVYVVLHRTAKAVKTPNDQRPKAARARVGHHPLKSRSGLRCAGLLFIRRNNGKAAAPGDLINFGSLVFDRLTVRGYT